MQKGIITPKHTTHQTTTTPTMAHIEQRAQRPKFPSVLLKNKKLKLEPTKQQADDRRRREEQRVEAALASMVKNSDKGHPDMSLEMVPVLRDMETGNITGILLKDRTRERTLVLGWHHMDSICTEEVFYNHLQHWWSSPFDLDEAVPPTPFPEDYRGYSGWQRGDKKEDGKEGEEYQIE